MADLNLFQQDSRIQMPDNTYFPFTHTISDLENINIIGVPITKQISIPRTPQNDELFGYICDITRDTFGYQDTKIGVSFNQIKKCEYRLQNDSEVVSEGLISVDDITDKEYKISLHDKLTEKLEDLDGEEDTGRYFLNDIDILSGVTPISFDSNATNIKTMITGLTQPIVPLVCIKDNQNDIADDKVRCKNVTGGTETVDLPIDCTSLQLRTLKSYEFNYGVPITTVIDGINAKYDNIITIDDSISGITNNTYMLLNSPVNEEGIEVITNDLMPGVSATSGSTYNYTIKNTSDYYLCTENGHKYMNLTIGVEYKTTVPTWIIGGVMDGPFWTETYYIQTTGETGSPNGTLFSKQWAKVEMINGDNSTNPIFLEMDLFKNTNAVFNDTGTGLHFTDQMKLITQIQLDLDFYPQFAALADESTKLKITIQNYNPAKPNIRYQIFGAGVYVNEIEIRGGSTCSESILPFRTNDIVTSKKILPKISIKEFVIQLAKFFNLDVIIEDDKLKLQTKKYYLSNDIIEVKSIDGMVVNSITFNKLKLSTSLPSSDTLDSYETKYKSPYGTQTINTGYSIKNRTKEIVLDTAIPILMRDVNPYAYQNFAGYLNGGYAKNPHGLVNELNDKITFCYVQRVNERLYVTDDSPYEGGMNNGTITGVTESTFLHYNPKLYVNLSVDEMEPGRFFFSGDTDEAYGVSVLDYYYTASPYYWSGTTIEKSLEMGKPSVNYAGIPDSWYPSGSTLYHKYHRNMLIDKYNSNTHILNAKIFIDGPLDIYKIYNYKGSYYIVSQATEYDPTKPDFYSVKLMRVNDPNNYINNIQ